MYELNEKLKKEIININKILSHKYKMILDKDSQDLRGFIEENIGQIIDLEAFSSQELAYFYDGGGIVGVDGSNNKMGGASPHYIELYQGLAKSTIKGRPDIYRTDFFSPLLEEEMEGEDLSDQAIRRRKLAEVELDVALESVSQQRPYAILMDGSLMRYKILSMEKWKELEEACLKADIVLIGLIEDIKTSIIGDELKTARKLDTSLYDRELLYGLLDYGQAIKIRPERSKKSESGIYSAFMRSSEDPAVIGLDILESQAHKLEEILRLVLSLTARTSRGIPLWLDIVDHEVRIEDKMIEGLLESYLDRSLYEIFFTQERDKRTI